MQTTDPSRTISLGIVILAAGRSTRMGQPKLLLPWQGTSVLGHLIAQWRSLGAAQIIPVCAAGDSAIPSELDRIGFPVADRICNLTPETGMFSSIQCAARWQQWKPGLTHWALVLGDQPHLRLETLQALVCFAASTPDHVCQPAHRGRHRHPVVLPKPVFQALATTSAGNLRDFLAGIPDRLATWEVDDPGLDLDLDYPADYQHALELAAQTPPRNA